MPISHWLAGTGRVCQAVMSRRWRVEGGLERQTTSVLVTVTSSASFRCNHYGLSKNLLLLFNDLSIYEARTAGKVSTSSSLATELIVTSCHRWLRKAHNLQLTTTVGAGLVSTYRIFITFLYRISMKNTERRSFITWRCLVCSQPLLMTAISLVTTPPGEGLDGQNSRRNLFQKKENLRCYEKFSSYL